MADPWKRKEVIGDCTLYLGDCLEVLPTLGRFDACVTDPPYGIGEDGGRFRARKGQNVRVLPNGNWDSKTPPAEAFDMMLACSDEQIIWGGNYFTDKLPPSKGWLYWQKLMGGDFADGELWHGLAATAHCASSPSALRGRTRFIPRRSQLR